MPIKYVTRDLFDERTKWIVDEITNHLDGPQGVCARLCKLEAWRNWTVGVGAALTAVVIPLLVIWVRSR